VRILLVSAEYPPFGDGIGAYVASVAPALAARGHEVHVLSCRAGQPRSDTVERGVRVHRRGQPPLPAPERLLPVAQRVRAALACARHARALGPFDVVEAPDWMAEGLLLGRRGGAPVVAHLHTPIGLVTRTSGLRAGRAIRAADALERTAVARADAVTAPSRLLARTLEADGWLARRRGPVTVVPYPVDPEPWAAVGGAGATPPIVLAVGRLERRKAPEMLVEACGRLTPEIPGLELVLAGRSEEQRDGMGYAEWLQVAAARAGVALRLAGEVARDALPALVARARVVAVPSRFDNFPMAALEALAAGRPVVCTDATGTADLLSGSDAGAVVPVGDPAALAAALAPYLRDADVAARAGAAARALAVARCSPEAVAERRETVYGEVAGRR
jgi:glycogen synthase